MAQRDLLDLTLEELMNTPIDVASRAPLVARESPGIITVIAGEQIRNSGARDLTDVLRQVPGFDFRLITSNVLGLGVRGHTGSDGRVLLLVDGIEVNEQRFGTAQLGHGFPLDSIDRIEVVRGSALAMYGTTAELGVIHIITRQPKRLEDTRITADVGMADGEHSRTQLELLAGNSFDNWHWSFSAYAGRALRSTATFSLPSGSYDMEQDDYLRPEYINLALGAGDFNLRYLRDSSAVDARATGTTIRPSAWHIQQTQEAVQISYPLSFSSLSITPSFLYQEQSPREIRTHTNELNSKTSLRRNLSKVDLVWDISDDWNLSGGGEYLDADYRGQVRAFPLRPLAYEHISNSAYYAEALYQSDWGNLLLGGRMDQHQYAGDLWAERLAYTKPWNDWHFKWISSRAERAPSLEDYSAGDMGLNIRDNEKVRSHELELGWRGKSRQQLTLNLFDIATQNTLILTNQGTTHTRGLELVYLHPLPRGEASISYSHYRAEDTSTDVALPRRFPDGELMDEDSHIGYAPHKISGHASYRLSDNISINPSLTWLSRRWVYLPPTVAPAIGTLQEAPSVTLVNIALDWRDAGVNGLDMNVSVHNLLNEQHRFYLPFRSTGSYLPDMGREWVLSLSYHF